MPEFIKCAKTYATLGEMVEVLKEKYGEYVEPAEFEQLRRSGLDLGFNHVEAGPLVRSSYHAAEQFDGDHDDES